MEKTAILDLLFSPYIYYVKLINFYNEGEQNLVLSRKLEDYANI